MMRGARGDVMSSLGRGICSQTHCGAVYVVTFHSKPVSQNNCNTAATVYGASAASAPSLSSYDERDMVATGGTVRDGAAGDKSTADGAARLTTSVLSSSYH
ncbi:uncharacterized protein LOC123498177 [Portunus trituberculatus]|uniref:uncharacterized protein LOC123498177 n=1 Tax=Portunus trituberculatus TaxID=210409 RepID=UPI001E1D1426|nr:uncharacterized protein LOC123498177 [Portunus trituberculatus]